MPAITTAPKTKLGTLVEQARVAAGLTQRQLAVELHISVGAYHTRINGSRPFNLPEAEALMRVLTLDPVDFFTGRPT